MHCCISVTHGGENKKKFYTIGFFSTVNVVFLFIFEILGSVSFDRVMFVGGTFGDDIEQEAEIARVPRATLAEQVILFFLNFFLFNFPSY